MIFYCLLLLLSIERTFSLSCPEMYWPIEEDQICIHWGTRDIATDDIANYCDGQAQGGVPFERRLSDKGLKELEKMLKHQYSHYFATEVYIGMEREKDAYGVPTKTFKYEGGHGSVHEDDYELWSGDPSKYDCGMVTYKNDFKVKPVSCSDSARYMCEKNELPCEDKSKNPRYNDYHGRCLLVVSRNDNYMYAQNLCASFGGTVATYKSRAETDAIIETIFNSIETINGGIYAGVRKKENGKFEYADGVEETTRWRPDDPLERDCGVFRFIKNETLGMATMSCDEPLRPLCTTKG